VSRVLASLLAVTCWPCAACSSPPSHAHPVLPSGLARTTEGKAVYII
jgi:hypothetical protein